jgi:integrase
VKLTEKLIAALTLRQGERERLIADDEMTGLRLRLRAGAKGITRTWVYKYSQRGHQRSFTFDHIGHSLAAARKRAGELQARLRLGQDPAQVRAEGRARAAETMRVVLPTYLTHKRMALKPRSYGEVERHLLRYFKTLHPYPLRQITPAMVATRYAAIAAGSGSTTANNSWRSLHAFLDWALRQSLIDRNPAVGTERAPDRRRDRILNATEIKAIWEATGGGGDYNAIIRLLLLTGCRASEISGLRWSEIFSDRIVIAAERVKNGLAHVVPITPGIRAILDRCKRRPNSDFVFGRDPSRAFTGWGSCKPALDERIKATGVEMRDWVLHDIRRSFATGACELGVAPHIVEAALNHISGFRHGVAGTYNRAALESPVRHALMVWGDHVTAIAAGRVCGDRVVPLGTKRS